MMLFEEIPSVFGASKYEQKVTEAPSSVSIVTSAEIKRYGYRSLSEILGSLRGFYVTNDRNYDYLGVRGFGRPGDYNSRILLLVDGQKLNDNIYSSAGLGPSFPLDVDLIDRVEVIRGPSSSLYGTSAFFGVINVITRRGRDVQGVEVSGEAGSHASWDGRATYGQRFPGGLEALVSATYGESDGQGDLYYPEFDDPETNGGISENNDGLELFNLFAKLAWGDFTLEGALAKSSKDIPTAPWETVFNDPRTRTIDEQSYLFLQYDHTFTDGGNLNARVHYGHYGYDGDYAYDYAETEEEDPYLVVNMDDAGGHWVGTEAQYTRRVLERHQVVLGGEYQKDYRQDQSNFDEEVYLDDRRDSDYWALYAQDDVLLLDNLSLNVGLRYDHYSTFGGTLNPRTALIFTPLEKTAIKLLYGEAFRAPSAYELYYHDGGETTKANPDLDPETIRTYEIVWEQYLGDHLRGVLGGFYYQIDHLINLKTDPSDDLLVFENIDEVRALGAEVELEGKWENGIEGRISYSFQETENKETGSILSNSPKHLAKLNLLLPLVWDKVFIAVEERYTSSRKTVQGGEVGGFALTNLTLSSQDVLEGLELSASIYNLFDKDYSDPGSEEHIQDAIAQEGRTFRFKVTYLF
ncbi:TonB-dependent receptor [uncultured Desulfuromonas sp.]|uniref:TonB-dependent receptor plug domain-containing protein n=1 Tax=uncultured Desulfuromonas sp. TaxID=181013 RepID=UPI002624D6BC|nr:TonB-dependent receptor [uncultured Desulfuromonas sp.]